MIENRAPEQLLFQTKKPNPLNSKNRYFVQVITIYSVPVISVLLAYPGVLSNGLVWDDVTAFKLSSLYQNTSNLTAIFRQPLIFFSSYYRPLVSSTFALQNQLFGVSPEGLHLFSLILHVLNTFLVTFISRRLLKNWHAGPARQYGALVIGLFYGLHPALIEPVSFISSRFDLMVTFFLLLAMSSAMVFRTTAGKSVAVGVFFLLASLCKEMSLGFALALPFWLLAIDAEPPTGFRQGLAKIREPGNFFIILSVFLSGLVYLLLRHNALGILFSPLATKDVPVFSQLLLVVRSIYEYVSLILLPFGRISPAHPVHFPVELADRNNVAALVFLGVLLTAATCLFRNYKRSFLFLVSTILSLVPVLNISPLPRPADMYFAESYLAFPLVMFSLFLLSIIDDLSRRYVNVNQTYRKIGYGVVGIWLVASVSTILVTVPLWKSDLTLFGWVVSQKPNLDRPKVNLAIELQNEKKYRIALKLIDSVLEKDKQDALAWNTRGKIFEKLGRKDESLKSYYRAVQLEPDYIDLKSDLAGALIRFKEYPTAKKVLLQILDRQPDFWSANYRLGYIYLQEKNVALARKYFALSLKYVPEGSLKNNIEKIIQELDK